MTSRDATPTTTMALRDRVEQLLPSIGAEAALSRLHATPLPALDRAHIVIVGEPKTGKTSLINALLARPGLLPVAPTTAYAAIGASATEAVRAHYDDGHFATGNLSHLPTLLRPDVGAGHVDRLEIGLDDARLAQLTLFDTPGVGGVDGAAARLTLAALEQASAVVFVCSAAAKISLAERRFLAEAATRIETIVFVLSKIDAQKDWKQILAENTDTLRGDFDRFPPGRFSDVVLIPTSARLAELGTPAAGIEELWARLHRIAATPQLTELNTLRAIGSALADASRILTDRENALDDASSDEHQFAELSRLVNELNQANAVWRTDLAREIDTARDAVRTVLRRRAGQLGAHYETLLQAKVARERIPEIEARIIDDLCVLQQQADTDVHDHVTEIARRLLAAVPGGATAAAGLADQLPAPGETPSEYLRERPLPPKDPSEAMLGVQTAFLGNNIARGVITAVTGTVAALTPLSIASPAVAVAALPVGLLWWRLNRTLRERTRDLNGLRIWVTKSISEATIEIGADIDRGFRHATYLLTDAVADTFSEALTTAKSDQKQLDRARDKAAVDLLQLNRLKKQLEPLEQSFIDRRSKLLPTGHPPRDALPPPATS